MSTINDGGPALPKLSAREDLALEAWAGTESDFGCLSFRAVAQRSSVEPHNVRRVVRSLARKGVTEFHRGLWSDEGDPRGSGYGLTDLGRSMLAARERVSS